MSEENIFCNFSDLRNESDVEQFFVIRLLRALGYKDKNIHTKETIEVRKIGKGKDRKSYKPDYLMYVNGLPKISIDAKSPEEAPYEGLRDALMYSREINGEYSGSNPIEYCIGTNGHKTQLSNWDENKPLLELNFNDFQFDNNKYTKLQTMINLQTIKSSKKKTNGTKNKIQFIKPGIGDIRGIFRACHNIIWNSEKGNPSFAFYEFVKIMFIKLDEDKKLRKNDELMGKIEMGLPIPEDDITFSINWIENQEKHDPNPVDSILFKNLKQKLEREIREENKKRIYDKDEQIRLKPSTIKRVVELLENLDLFGIDEDLNGRLFEAFLTATMRGPELGQYFTPSNVVDFMTDMADLKVSKDHIDRVLDGCCGTGGFLIEAMMEMCKKIEENNSLSDVEKDNLIEKIKNDYMYGVDVGKEPPIARIARINMYLHKDGGSRIYQLDTLDKEIKIEKGIDEELKNDMLEFKQEILNGNLKFDVILTNPPFAMRYSQASKKKKLKKEEKKALEQERILKQYELAETTTSSKYRKSLKSSIMFLERYWELLEPHGKLITVMDEGILNTSSKRYVREFIQEKFIVKAVIALPDNTFVNAESGVKSSILYLVKKKKPDEKQPDVFMAISENVGHNDAGKPTPEKCDLDEILEKFQRYEKHGKL
jgi:type I restriction enzyme M protein